MFKARTDCHELGLRVATSYELATYREELGKLRQLSYTTLLVACRGVPTRILNC